MRRVSRVLARCCWINPRDSAHRSTGGLSLNKIWWQTLFHHGTRRGRAGSAPREPRAGQWDEREDFGLQRLRQCYKLLGRTGLQGRQSAVDRLSERTVLDITKGRRVGHNHDVFVRVHTSASVERAVEPVRLQVPSVAQAAACRNAKEGGRLHVAEWLVVGAGKAEDPPAPPFQVSITKLSG